MKKGISASSGYAVGYVIIKEEEPPEITEYQVEDWVLEKQRLEKALELSRNQLLQIKRKVEIEMGSDQAAVFEGHMMLLGDPEFTGAMVLEIQTKHINAEKALKDIVEMYMQIFSSMEDEYMRERASDVIDVARRIFTNLQGKNNEVFRGVWDNAVIVAHDLTPSDTAQLDKDKVVAFLTNIGGRTSHSAIMARTLEIPAVVGLKDITEHVKDGDLVIVDGVEGIVILEPDEETIREYEKKKEAYGKEKDKLKRLVHVETLTRSGRRTEIAGNIGRPEDIHKVLENGGEGIGLFRTEFLYMDRDEMPSEEEQLTAYRDVLTAMGNKPVVIRTLDIGGDKRLRYLHLNEEINPFLGFRAIRLSLERKEIFKVQLRALLRSSVYGNVKIMFPMISCLEEFLKAKELVGECMEELRQEEKPFDEKIQMGIMIEVPAAAIMADELAKHVDFFSIGTNDLIQYTFAADRLNEKVSYLYKPMHPAVLRLIKMTIDAAHKEGKWCGMCGEMAGDEEAIPILVEYGLDEFSMSASSILKAKQIIMNLD